MDHLLLPVESLPQIDFGNTRNEDADKTARQGYLECNFTDLFDNENQQSSSLDKELWSHRQNQNLSWKNILSCDIVKGTPATQSKARIIKNELEAFLKYD